MQVEVLPDSQKSPESEAEGQKRVPSDLPGGPEVVDDPAEIPHGDETPASSIQLRRNIQLEQIPLIDEDIPQDNEVHYNIGPMASEILRPSGQAVVILNPVESQQLLECGNQAISDPEESDLSDHRELLKDQNFGKLKAGNLASEPAGEIEMEPFRNIRIYGDKDSRRDVEDSAKNAEVAAKDAEDAATNAEEYLEVEACDQPLRPPEDQCPEDANYIMEVPNEEEANAARPPNEGYGNVRREADAEEIQRQLDERDSRRVAKLFDGYLFIITVTVSCVILYKTISRYL